MRSRALVALVGLVLASGCQTPDNELQAAALTGGNPARRFGRATDAGARTLPP